MHKKFQINQTKVKSAIKVVTHNSKSDLPLVHVQIYILIYPRSYDINSTFFFSMLSLEMNS